MCQPHVAGTEADRGYASFIQQRCVRPRAHSRGSDGHLSPAELIGKRQYDGRIGPYVARRLREEQLYRGGKLWTSLANAPARHLHLTNDVRNALARDRAALDTNDATIRIGAQAKPPFDERRVE